MAPGGDVNLGGVTVRYGGGNRSDLTYRVYAKAFADAHEYHSDGDSYDAWRSAQTSFRMEWDEAGIGKFTLQGDGYLEKAGAGAGPLHTARFTDATWLRIPVGANILGRWQLTLSPDNDIQVQAYIDSTNHRELKGIALFAAGAPWQMWMLLFAR
jgi:hypothetical protein